MTSSDRTSVSTPPPRSVMAPFRQPRPASAGGVARRDEALADDEEDDQPGGGEAGGGDGEGRRGPIRSARKPPGSGPREEPAKTAVWISPRP